MESKKEYTDIIQQKKLERVCIDLLLAIGEDPGRPGLQETPRRWAGFWQEFINYEPGSTETTFEAVTSDQLVVVSGMRVWSLCEHHLLPFWCDIAVGYIPGEHVLGLSKFARIAHQFAHRLQLQERLCHQVAEEVIRIAETPNVAVLARGEHLCMSMRGIKTPSIMTSTVMKGVFGENAGKRDEFLSLARGDK